LKAHDLFLKKPDEFFFVHGTFKDVERNVPITSECRENGETLSTDEELPTNTPPTNFCPSRVRWLVRSSTLDSSTNHPHQSILPVIPEMLLSRDDRALIVTPWEKHEVCSIKSRLYREVDDLGTRLGMKRIAHRVCGEAANGTFCLLAVRVRRELAWLQTRATPTPPS